MITGPQKGPSHLSHLVKTTKNSFFLSSNCLQWRGNPEKHPPVAVAAECYAPENSLEKSKGWMGGCVCPLLCCEGRGEKTIPSFPWPPSQPKNPKTSKEKQSCPKNAKEPDQVLEVKGCSAHLGRSAPKSCPSQLVEAKGRNPPMPLVLIGKAEV